jgi:K+-sensing histidine kinase KdpD
MTFLNRSLRWPFVYLAGVALVGLVVAAFQQWSPPTLLAWPLLVLLLPVLGSAMIGGPRTALCAAAVAVLAADWFLLPPGQGFKVPGALDFSAMIAFGRGLGSRGAGPRTRVITPRSHAPARQN